MADVIFVAVIVAFFAIAALFVVACDHIIGADENPGRAPIVTGVTGHLNNAALHGTRDARDYDHEFDSCDLFKEVASQYRESSSWVFGALDRAKREQKRKN